ncbi:MAG: AAA family ATPase [Spirochaetales bacterium]|nr:AAA family ATPase [Spirochaetales bacterium]
MSVQRRIAAILKRLNAGLYEKEEVVALALLSALAGESIFLLGPPGVAKSMIARRLKFVFQGGTSFEYLMSRFSTPDEIFGPVSISRLKNDRYERLTENYLPSASVVFLDEIWKAGPSIQNALLTVLNERVYRNGEVEIRVPMKALVSASNELPEKDNGLAALWDRFLVRVYVEGIRDGEEFRRMISGSGNSYGDTVPDADKITEECWREWTAGLTGVRIPEHVFGVIEAVRVYIGEHNQKEENAENHIYISDRRWRKIVRLLRASAFLNGRGEAALIDCVLIRHCIWNEMPHREAAAGFVNDAVEKHGYSSALRLPEIREELAAFQEEIAARMRAGRAGGSESAAAEYYELDGYPNPHADVFSLMVRSLDFAALTEKGTSLALYYRHTATGQIAHTQTVRMSRGTGSGSLVINGKEYVLKSCVPGTSGASGISGVPGGFCVPGASGGAQEEGGEALLRAAEAWDSRAGDFLKCTGRMRGQVEKLRAKELRALKGHLFVPPGAAGSVEAHFALLLKEIEKLEVEIRGIRNSYRKIRE